MLHLEYKVNDYKGCHIDIQPGSETEIPGLRDMLMHAFMVDNPARTFAKKMKHGGFQGCTEEEIESEAEVADVLSDLWGNEPVMNVMLLLSRAMQMIVDLRLG